MNKAKAVFIGGLVVLLIAMVLTMNYSVLFFGIILVWLAGFAAGFQVGRLPH